MVSTNVSLSCMRKQSGTVATSESIRIQTFCRSIFRERAVANAARIIHGRSTFVYSCSLAIASAGSLKYLDPGNPCDESAVANIGALGCSKWHFSTQNFSLAQYSDAEYNSP